MRRRPATRTERLSMLSMRGGCLSDLARSANACFALKQDQIERRRGAGDRGQQGMRLAAMVGLMVEEMVECRRKLLLHVDRIGDGPVAEPAGEVSVSERIGIAQDAFVLGAPGVAQGGEILM